MDRHMDIDTGFIR